MRGGAACHTVMVGDLPLTDAQLWPWIKLETTCSLGWRGVGQALRVPWVRVRLGTSRVGDGRPAQGGEVVCLTHHGLRDTVGLGLQEQTQASI